MKPHEKLWAVTLAVVVVAGVFYGANAMGESQARLSEEAKQRALENAKNGWVYICGWSQCTWNRIPREAKKDGE